MSIASEIEALSTNLQAAKTAVTTAGGTVGDTGLAGLATEIASIPTGGGGTLYGYYEVATLDTVTFDIESEQSVTVQITDAEKFFQFLTEKNFVRFENDGTGIPKYWFTMQYNESSGGWYNERDFENAHYYSTEEMAEYGVTLTVTGQYASFNGSFDITINTDTLEQKEIRGPLELETFGYSESGGMGDSGKVCVVSADEYIFKPFIVSLTLEDEAAGVDLPGGFVGWFANLTTLNIPFELKNTSRSFCQYCVNLTDLTINGENELIIADNAVIGDSMFYYAKKLNVPIVIGDNAKIGSSFLANCSAFDSPITFGNNVRLSPSFLSACVAFNQPLDLSTIQADNAFTSSFLSNCRMFNYPLAFPTGITAIGSTSLNNCVSLNSPITIPSTVTSIGYAFLSGCTSFNQPLTIPTGVTSLGYAFLYNCSSFNQPLTFPSGISFNNNAQNLMYNCKSMVSTITMNVAPPSTAQNTVLATNDSTAACYVQGIPIGGTYGTNWRSKYSNSSSNPYRKLKAA